MSLRRSDRYWTGRHGLPVGRRVAKRRIHVDLGREAHYTVHVENDFSAHHLTLLISEKKPRGFVHYDGRIGSQEYHDRVDGEIGGMTAIEFFEIAVGCSLKALEKARDQWLSRHPEVLEMMEADAKLLSYALG